MLVALGCDRMIRTELEERVRRYGTLDPALLRATGGDRFPDGLLHVVPS